MALVETLLVGSLIVALIWLCYIGYRLIDKWFGRRGGDS